MTLHTSHSRGAAGAGVGWRGGWNGRAEGRVSRYTEDTPRCSPNGGLLWKYLEGGLKGDKLSGAEWGGSAARALGVRCRQQVV